MASHAPMLACLFLSFVALSTTGLIGKHLPPWFLASLRHIRSANRVPFEEPTQLSEPEKLIVEQLQRVDAGREPETARALHAALGNMLLASGARSKQAVQHLEAARDAAARGTDPDALLAARIELAEAYIEEGRALDSQEELTRAAAAPAKNFADYRAKMNRGYGHARFEQGWTESALHLFEEAQEQAIQPLDKVHIACDRAMARACLGQASKSLQPLRQALGVLYTAQKAGADGGIPAALQNTLAADINFRLAEAFHSISDIASAGVHYKKALHLQQKSPVLKTQRVLAIKKGITNLEQGQRPELRCPSQRGALRGKVQGPRQNMKNTNSISKIDLMLDEHRYDLVESELKAALSTQSRPYRSHEAATSLQALGNLYRKQRKFTKAAAQYVQALRALMACCAPTDRLAYEDAKAAYEGLKGIKSELSEDDQMVAAVEMARYMDAYLYNFDT